MPIDGTTQRKEICQLWNLDKSLPHMGKYNQHNYETMFTIADFL
jgi:hypothetical protein